MPADVFVAISFCVILLGVLSTDLFGRLFSNRSLVNEVVAASTRANIHLARPIRGMCQFNLDSHAERNLVVFVNGRRQQELKLSGDTSLNIIVA